MLNPIHLSSLTTATSAPTAALARTPRRLLAARTLEELRSLLESVLTGLYQEGARFELYVASALGDLEPVAGPEWTVTSAARQLLASVGSRLAASGGSLAEPHVLPALHHLRRGAVVTAPLLGANEALLGLLVVEARPGSAEYTSLHAAVLEGVAALASVAVQRLRPTDADRLRARIDLDRVAARRVQRRLMSSRLPAESGVKAYAEYVPSLDVGGDFYSVKHVGDHAVTVAIGDVSGHGVSAALVMSRVAADIERALVAGGMPAAVLGAVNDSLSDVDSEMFVTASCIRLDTRRRTLTIANAGHLPILVRRAGGEVFTCGAASGVPLGMVPCQYEDEEVVLERSDIVLLATDGLLEALDHPSGARGMDRLMALVRDAPHDAGRLHARLRAAVAEARSAHVLDDITWVGLQVVA